MKNIVLIPLSLFLLSCSNKSEEEIPEYVGQYYLIKSYAIVDGTKGNENIHEGTCFGKSNYNIKIDKSILHEVYAAQSGKCQLVGSSHYIYDSNNNIINGEKVKFEGNYLTITNTSTGTQTIENIYIYKK